MNLLIDLRGCHINQERGIPNYAQTLALAMAKAGRATYSFLVHKDRPKLNEEENLRQFGSIAYYEDICRVGVPRCDVSSDERDAWPRPSLEFERLAIPPAVAAHQPMICAIIYDLIPLIFKGVYLHDQNVARGYMTALHVLRRCDHLFAISDSSAHDAARLVGISPSKVTTINGGVNRERWTKSASQNAAAQGHAAEVIYIGGDDFRKNMIGLIRGFGLFKRHNPDSVMTLAIVCSLSEPSRRHLEEVLTSEGLTASVDVTGFLSLDDLIERVSLAKASIFPSLYEGLGLPILESYSVDTPAFGSNNSSVKRLVHPKCQFDPYSTDSIAETFEKIDRGPDLLQTSIGFGRWILTQFDWDRSANIVLSNIAGNVFNRVSYGRMGDSERPVAILGPVSPEQTGVGIFNSKAFGKSRWPIVIFTELTDERSIRTKNADLVLWSQKADLKMALISEHPRYCPMDRYQATVIVIGNSAHCVPALRTAIDHRASRGSRVLYLHEARVTGLLLSYFAGDFTATCIKAWWSIIQS